MTDFELRQYLADLERRCANYAEQMNAAVEQRDRLALDAAWGVASSLSGWTSAALVWAVFYYAGAREWYWWTLAFVVSLVVYSFAWKRANDMRMKEVESFDRLPEWEYRDPFTK